MENKISTLQKKDAGLAEQINRVEESQKKLGKSLSDLNKGQESLKNDLDAINSSLKKKISVLQKAKKNLDENIKDLHGRLNDRTEKLGKKIDGLDKEKVSAKWVTGKVKDYFDKEFSRMKSSLTDRISTLQSSMNNFKLLKSSLYSR